MEPTEMMATVSAALRPLHDAVVALGLSLGDDVRVEGRSTYAPLVRRTQLAAVAPGPTPPDEVGDLEPLLRAAYEQAG